MNNHSQRTHSLLKYFLTNNTSGKINIQFLVIPSDYSFFKSRFVSLQISSVSVLVPIVAIDELYQVEKHFPVIRFSRWPGRYLKQKKL